MTESALPPAGFRLDRLELWNWGTFDGDVQVLDARCGWALLVGENGSGKSTAIDALRTLLVPPRILNYNDAALDGRRGAGRDRTRRSYVRGAWASSSTIDSTSPTTRYLRDPGTLSAIAAVFTDARQQASVTVAQVLWEHEEQVRDIYAATHGRRSLTDLLAGQANTGDIKRAARRAGWHIEDTFAAYAERMRALLHIPGDKALEVFNRAIGMKEVSDIDAFVRQFMLPTAETFGFVRDTLLPHYRTLLDCWAAIERAERQITLLRPVVGERARIRSAEAKIEAWKRLQTLARPYFASRHLALLQARHAELASSVASAEMARGSAASELAGQRRERDDVTAAINATDVGPRLQSIDRELEQAEQAMKGAQSRRGRLEPAIKLLDAVGSVRDAAAFAAARPGWEGRERLEGDAARREDELRAAHKHQQELALKARMEKGAELESIERHRVNIPREYIALRTRVAHAAGVAVDAIPFAGELMEVRQEFADWTGAIERLLRGFGLSLLVPERSYRPVAEFINATFLGLRLVFHRVPAGSPSSPALSNDCVPGRLAFRTDHPLYLWVVSELVQRFNHRCCDSIADLERVDRGLTRQGLVRNRARHIKDDLRGSVDDPSDRVLGWSTERKIAALRQQCNEAEARATAESQSAALAHGRASEARDRERAARDLLGVAEFSEIDPERWSAEVVRLRREWEFLERSSAHVRSLQDRLRQIEAAIADGETALRQLDGDLGGLKERLTTCRDRIQQREGELQGVSDSSIAGAEAGFADVLAGLPALTLENVEQLASSAQHVVQGRINREAGQVNDATEKMAASMSEFLREFTEYRQTLAVGRDYADGFAAALERIEHDDLPAYREKFEQYLNENLVGDLLMLNQRLEEHRDAIEERINEINGALLSIDYADNTYVQLRLTNTGGNEVAEFRRRLRSCFEHGLAPAPGERMQVFERVRELLETFQRDPEGTQRVTDVRTWVAAGVRELRRSDDSEVNYYMASTGKSGGQKAKLAFTILASALSAQYGLSTASVGDARNFRLVVIDEAFSRTDEFNSTSAMKLFARLGFQLLIVGPFDAKAKLAVPFVGTVHLSSNPSGSSSRLMVLSREEALDASHQDASEGDQSAQRSPRSGAPQQ